MVSSSDPCNPELAEALTPMISPRVPIILTTMKDVGEVGVDDMWNPAVRGRGKRGKCPLLMRTLFLFWHRLRSVLGFHSFCPSSSLMPSPEDLIFSQSHAEWASFEAQVSSLLLVVVFLPFVFALFDRFGLLSLFEGKGESCDRSV